MQGATWPHLGLAVERLFQVERLLFSFFCNPPDFSRICLRKYRAIARGVPTKTTEATSNTAPNRPLTQPPCVRDR